MVCKDKVRYKNSMYKHTVKMVEELMELEGVTRSELLEQLVHEEYYRRIKKIKPIGEDTDK